MKQIACPSCHTAYRVDPPDLGAEGRTVRCTRCRTTWFANPSDMVPLAVMQEALAGGEASSASAGMLPQIVPWNDTVMVDVNPGPTLVPHDEGDVLQMSSGGRRTSPEVRFTPVRSKSGKSDKGQTRIVAMTVMMAAVLFAAINYRTTLVRYVPGLAGLFLAVGLPVNLRGLEFRSIRTSRETQDGAPVLTIEGEVVNITRQPVEVPRLRLAIMGPEERELYAWTALLPRAVLPGGESLPFRSRLASPPAEGKTVLIRFLNRADLTLSGR